LIAINALRTQIPSQDISFIEWFIFSFLICSIALVVVFVILKWRFSARNVAAIGYDRIQTAADDIEMISMGHHMKNDEDEDHEDTVYDDDNHITRTGKWKKFIAISSICASILGWIFFSYLEPIFGHMGIWGLICIVVLFACHVLEPSDWQNGIPWHIIALLGGGLVIGESVKSSGLLEIFGSHLIVSQDHPWLLYVSMVSGICIVANFLSSSVCSLISMPLIVQIGNATGHAKLFVIACALMTSGAMGLPVSSFPNSNAAAVSSGTSSPSVGSSTPKTTTCVTTTISPLSTWDFITTGFPITVGIWFSIITIGYAYGLMIGM
jgi:di/tricarboxylate transporter